MSPFSYRSQPIVQGNSPVVSQFSAHEMPGVPGSWQTTLFETGKATLLKIHIPSLVSSCRYKPG